MTTALTTLENSGVATIEAYAANLEKKMQMCKVLRESGFAPVSFKTDGAVLAAILYGQELGFSPIQSLQSIDVIQGKPTVNAQGMKAKIYQSGGIVTEITWSDKVCSLEGTRSGHKQVATYTMDDARLAGLTGKDNWKRMPKAMLYARAVTMLARNQWADVIKGLYGAEEMQDAAIEVMPAEPSQPALAAIPNLKTADDLQKEATQKVMGNDDLSFNSSGKPDMPIAQTVKKIYHYDLASYFRNLSPEKKLQAKHRLEQKQGFILSGELWCIPEFIKGLEQYLVADDSIETEAA